MNSKHVSTFDPATKRKLPEDAGKSERAQRLNADAWAHAALDVVAESGIAAVAVEPLARRLGVTKGSFYWHFPTRDALLAAALERWEQLEEEEIFGKLEAIASPRERLQALFQLVAGQSPSHVIFSELIKSAEHPLVAPVIERVLQRRLAHLTVLFTEAGLTGQSAINRARLAYSVYVGSLHLANRQLSESQRMPQEQFESYVEHAMQTLIPHS